MLTLYAFHATAVAPAHLANRGPNPRAVVVEALNAVVIDGAVVRARRLVEVAGVVVAHRHPVAIHVQVLAPTSANNTTVECTADTVLLLW
jgi:hypothetical protein